MESSNTDLVTSLKQLVISFYPYIKEAESFEHVQDAILHMEELDPNFHRLFLYIYCVCTFIELLIYASQFYVDNLDSFSYFKKNCLNLYH